LRAAFSGEAAFRQLLLINLLLIPLAFYLQVSRGSAPCWWRSACWP
jgi:diacylglycerol kinase (ATP)